MSAPTPPPSKVFAGLAFFIAWVLALVAIWTGFEGLGDRLFATAVMFTIGGCALLAVGKGP